MFHRLFYPRQALLVSAAHGGKANLSVTNWVTPASLAPPALVLSLQNTSLTLELINHSKEFVLAIPHDGMREAMLVCLSASGRYIDKFSESKLTPEKAELVSAPLVKEALANIECKVLNIINCGQNSLIVAEVVKTHFPEDDGSDRKLLFDHGEKDLFAFELVPLGKPLLQPGALQANGKKTDAKQQAI